MDRRTRFGLALWVAAGSATAMPVATLDGRDSVTHVAYSGGFAISGDSGSDGSLDPMTTLDPKTLDLGGAHTFDGSYLYWTVTYTVNWNLDQSYAVDAHTISGQGSMHLDESSAVVGPGCAPCAATVAITGRDNQALQFSLDGDTAYGFHSEATGGQWLELMVFDDASGRWIGLWNGALETQGKVFDRSGTLAAGRYRLRNNPYDFTADGSPPAWDLAWSYTLTLPDAVVVAVPEPATVLMGLAGAVVLAVRLRHGGGPNRARPRS